jgi:hypothetical protein
MTFDRGLRMQCAFRPVYGGLTRTTMLGQTSHIHRQRQSRNMRPATMELPVFACRDWLFNVNLMQTILFPSSVLLSQQSKPDPCLAEVFAGKPS